MVPSTDAVPHPRAVVVKLAHTATAGSGRGQCSSTATHITVQGLAPLPPQQQRVAATCMRGSAWRVAPARTHSAGTTGLHDTQKAGQMQIQILVNCMFIAKRLFAEGLLIELYITSFASDIS